MKYMLVIEGKLNGEPQMFDTEINVPYVVDMLDEISGHVAHHAVILGWSGVSFRVYPSPSEIAF